MLKEYRKTATIKAEQFDGSFEMMEKYPITYAPFVASIAPPGYSLRTLDELETKLSSQLARQYVKGWDAGRKALVQELQKGIGGHK